VTFESNVVRVLSAQGYGGAIHIDSGTLELQDCSLHGNTVQLASNVAEDASGGGIFVSLQASALLVRVRMHSQQAGGVGVYEMRGDQAEAAQRHRAERAEHLLVWGVARLELCSVLSISGSSAIANAASAQVVVANGGRVALLNSLLSSSEPGRVALQLIGNTAQGIISRLLWAERDSRQLRRPNAARDAAWYRRRSVRAADRAFYSDAAAT
jgi:hypothetical protein